MQVSKYRNLDLTKPLQVRKWLRFFENDEVTAIRLKKNLSVEDCKQCGFSINSNNIGFRGPANSYGGNLVVGTSFAMGICVDNGFNWWDNLENSIFKNTLNIGFPYGMTQALGAFKEYYKGSCENLFIIWHPNFLEQEVKFKNIKNYKNSIQELRWKTGWLDCLLLTLKLHLKKTNLIKSNRLIPLKNNGKIFYLDNLYCYIDRKKRFSELNASISCINEIAKKFKNIFMIRVQTKQDVIHGYKESKHFNFIQGYYNDLWKTYCSEMLSVNKKIDTVEYVDANISDFHVYDNHWNESGNKKFQLFVSNYF